MGVRHVRLGPFLGVVTTRGQDSPAPYASAMLNARVGDGKLRPRYGFSAGTNRLGTDAVYGLAWLTGYDDDYEPRREWVAIEERSGRVAPFSVNPTSGVRTEIGSSESLVASPWRGICYGGTSYWINGDSPISVYRHDVGSATSWEPLETIESAAPPSDVVIETITPPYEEFHDLDPADVVTDGAGCGHGSMSNTASNASGVATLQSNDYPTGGYQQGWMEMEIEFAAAKDWSGGVALHYRIQQGLTIDVVGNDGFGSLQAENYIRLENSAATASANLPALLAGTLDQKFGEMWAWVDLGGVSPAILADVKKLTIRFRAFKTGVSFYRLLVLELGGRHYTPSAGDLEDAASGTWPDLQYAVRYVEGATTGDAYQATLPASDHLGDRAHADLPYLGSQVQIRVPAAPSPFTSAADVELFRKVDGTWRLLHTANADIPLVYEDDLTDEEIEADPVTYPETDLTISAPEFVSRGVVAAFPMLSWVCWLYPGGRENVRHSRVGDPERQAASGDEIDDTTRGATFALSDDLSDEPVAGLAIGNACVLFGAQGVHAQVGNAPSELTPPRKIVGAPPIANGFAYAGLSIDGVPGVAYVDASAEAVWWIGSNQAFATDAAARPLELTINQRGLVRAHLLGGGAGIEDLRLATDPHTGALWVVAGDRALKLTPPNPIDGQRQWEPYEFAIPVPEHTVPTEACLPAQNASSASSAARAGSTIAWTGPSNALSANASGATAAMTVGAKTEALVLDGFAAAGLPPGATLTALKLRVLARATTLGTAPVDVVDDLAQLTLSGTPVGSNAATLTPLTSSYAIREYVVDPEAAGITAADLIAGDVGAQIGYKSIPEASFNGGDFSISYVPNGQASIGLPTTTAPWSGAPPWTEALVGSTLGKRNASSAGSAIVRATYTGGGSAPSFVTMNVMSLARASANGRDGASISVNDGQGGSGGGGVEGEPYEVTHTVKRKAALASGNYDAQISGMEATVTSGEDAEDVPIVTRVDMSASVVDPDDATADVDVVQLVICYEEETTVPAAPTGGQWRFLAFTPDRRLGAIAERGRLDELEWDADAGAYVEGANRDGGSAMPAGYWESGEMRDRNRRLTHVSADSAGTLSVTAYADEAPNEGVTRAMTDRTERFPMECRGWNHRIRISVGESLTRVDGLTLREHTLGERLDR